MSNQPQPTSKNWISPALLAGILILGAFLRFYQLGASGLLNEYYAAAVKSMLTSWHNFFFVSFEPGGSISVDKPPLGLWLESLSAVIFGLNGFALAFPNALAGTLAIPLLYRLVAKQFGQPAGLAAALVLAVTPVSIAAERNNTMDGLLVFSLLLACWFTWRAVESGKLGHLLLAAFLLGLGFNIKMLQAYMVLPALLGLYLFGARHAWPRRLLHLGLAALLLLVVSFAWAAAVDAVPAANRPFIGSTAGNSMFELIFTHNGLKRLSGSNPGPGTSSGENPPGPSGKANELGLPGLFRLFNQQLGAQVSWLLPLALAGLILALFQLGKPQAPSAQHLALLLWAGWLLPEVLYFSFTNGLWHAYYLIMLGPPLAALVGVTLWAMLQLLERGNRQAGLWVAVLSGFTLGSELYILAAYRDYFAPAGVCMLLPWLAGLALLLTRQPGLRRWALGLMLSSLLVGPLLWSDLTTFNPQPEVHLPKAGPQPGQTSKDWSGATLNPLQQKLLDYLLANQGQAKYLVATVDSFGASPFILATGRPVLTLGGYIGSDNIVDLRGLKTLISSGRLRFVLDNHNLSIKPNIDAWVQSNCAAVQVPDISPVSQGSDSGRTDPRSQSFANLYDCQSK